MAMQKKLQFGAGSMTAAILVAAVLVVVNLLGLAFYRHWDFTDGKIYSLSEFSKKVMRELDDVILVKLYFTEDLPAPYNANSRYIKDQLYEYKAFSGGKMKFEIIDPVRDQKEDEARGLDIPAVQVNAIEKDKIELKRVYMGLAILFEDKQEVLPLIQSTRNLEYDITSAIKRVTADTTITVGLLAGHGEPSVAEELNVITQLMQKQYQVQPVTITHGAMIPKDIHTLLVIGPTMPLSAFELYAVDQFIMGGGKVGWFLDPVQVDLMNQTATNLATNLDTLLRSYGIVLNKELIIDARNSWVAVMQRQGGIQFQSVVEYPLFPEAVIFDEQSLITKDLGAINFPYVSSIDTTAAEGLGIVLSPLVYSSERSGRRRQPYYLQPQQQWTLNDFPEARIPLAATAIGMFSSHYNEHPVPDSGLGALPVLQSHSPVNRMVVVADSDFMRDRSSRSPENLAFFLNIVDWLSQDEGLITIRSRESTSRPLDPTISDGARWRYKYLNILGPSLLVVVFGVVRWRVRKSRRRLFVAARRDKPGDRYL